jgi:hypothetical protein
MMSSRFSWDILVHFGADEDELLRRLLVGEAALFLSEPERTPAPWLEFPLPFCAASPTILGSLGFTTAVFRPAFFSL